MAAQPATPPNSNSKELFIIDGGTVRHVEMIERRTVDTVDFLNRVQVKKQDISTPILPIGTRLYKVVGKDTMYIIERRPAIWNVTYGQSKDLYALAIPWQLYRIFVNSNGALGNVSLAFSTKPIRAEADNVYFTALPNQFDGIACCMGSAFNEIAGDKSTSINEKLDRAVAYFQESAFNDDLPVYDDRIPDAIRNTKLANSEHPADQNLPNYIKVGLDPNSTTNRRVLSRWHVWTMRGLHESEQITLSGICNMSWRRYANFASFSNSRTRE